MYPHWEHNMELILDWLENTPQVQTVFIHNRWIELVNNHRDTRLKQLVADGLRHTCARLRKAGKQIVLLGPVPEWTFGPRKLMPQCPAERQPDRPPTGRRFQHAAASGIRPVGAHGIHRPVPLHSPPRHLP